MAVSARLPLRLPENLTEEEIRKELELLGFRYSKSYSVEPLMEAMKKYLAVKHLKPQAVWDNYILLGITDLREQIMLRSAKNELRTVISRTRKKIMEDKAHAKSQNPKKTARRVRGKGKGKSTTENHPGCEQ